MFICLFFLSTCWSVSLSTSPLRLRSVCRRPRLWSLAQSALRTWSSASWNARAVWRRRRRQSAGSCSGRKQSTNAAWPRERYDHWYLDNFNGCCSVCWSEVGRVAKTLPKLQVKLLIKRITHNRTEEKVCVVSVCVCTRVCVLPRSCIPPLRILSSRTEPLKK